MSRKILQPALNLAKLRSVNMHSLRHSFASALIEGGASIAEVQSLMGHANPSTTLRVYTHFFSKRRESAAVLNLTKSLCGSSWTLSGHFENQDGGAGERNRLKDQCPRRDSNARPQD